jgi:hypothetical protein
MGTHFDAICAGYTSCSTALAAASFFKDDPDKKYPCHAHRPYLQDGLTT